MSDSPAPHTTPLSDLVPADKGPIRVMVLAFEGWNDAGEAASDALRALSSHFSSEVLSTLQHDDYYDFQFTRPQIMTDTDGERRLKWPQTTLTNVYVDSAEIELLVATSVEPSYKWKQFSEELVDAALAWDAHFVIIMGALLADVPHTRPIPISRTSDNPNVRKALGIDKPTYQGPVGILSVVSQVAEQSGLPTMSLWAAVPHYVGQAPSPKAQLALLKALEELLGVQVDLSDVEDDAEAWERGVNELATEDPEVEQYVKQLEEAKDTADLPEASGESIAKEFERYLRKRKD